MELRSFKDELFAKGSEVGFSEMEIYYSADRNTTVRVFGGEIDSYNIAEKAGLSFRGMIGGKMGYSYTEKIDADSIDLLLQGARENAELIEADEKEELFAGSESYVDLPLHSEALANVPSELVIDTALRLEQATKGADPRIDMVNYCMVIKEESETTIINTKGLDVHKSGTIGFAYASAVAKEEGDIATGAHHSLTKRDLAELNVDELAKTAAHEAVSKLKAQSIESDYYPIILRNNTAAVLLNAFSTCFAADQAEKGLSLLQGRLGEQVAGSNITIIDDPHLPDGPGSTPFDAEGMATSKHDVIRAGQLVTFLHNLKSAKKAGVESTGNAMKTTYRSTVTISPNNLYVSPGEASLDELIQGMERGLLLIELQGVHAGVNKVSGDFSLACLGHLIENGKIVRAVNQITVSGNFFEMLNQVEAIGSDLRFEGFGQGACGSPSLKIKSLSISGQ